MINGTSTAYEMSTDAIKRPNINCLYIRVRIQAWDTWIFEINSRQSCNQNYDFPLIECANDRVYGFQLCQSRLRFATQYDTLYCCVYSFHFSIWDENCLLSSVLDAFSVLNKSNCSFDSLAFMSGCLKILGMRTDKSPFNGMENHEIGLIRFGSLFEVTN